ncbi:MAG: sigma-70 family RNA polymerase sigma factor [Mobilitalea sp.]
MRDDKILKLIKARDEKGLLIITDKYGKLLTYIAANILGNRTMDIEECVNDTYLKIWTHIDKYDFNKASLKTYLKTITRNTALNKIRDIGRTEIMLHSEEIDEVLEKYIDYYADPEKKTIDRESIETLEGIIKNLKQEDKELVIRRYFYLQSSKNISKTMEMSVTAIDNRLSRLRTKMKREFERRELNE